MRNIHKMQSGTQLPKVLGGSLSPTFAFQSSGAGFSFTRSELSGNPGVYQFKIFDDAGTMVDMIHHGVTAAVTGNQTINLEATSNTQFAHTQALDYSGGSNCGTTPGTSSFTSIAKLWNDANIGYGRNFFTHSRDVASPRVPSLTTGEAVEVGVGYTRIYDAATGDDIFVMQHYYANDNTSTDTLPYPCESTVQGVANTPIRNSTFGITAMADSATATTVRTAMTYLLNGTNPGGAGACSVYWAKDSYDGDLVKTGSNGTDRWVEFYQEGELIAMCQFGSTATTSISGETTAKSWPVGEGGNVRYRGTCNLGVRETTDIYARTDTTLTKRTRSRNVATDRSSYYIGWWVKEP